MSVAGVNVMSRIVQIPLSRQCIVSSQHRCGGIPEISMLRHSLGGSMREQVAMLWLMGSELNWVCRGTVVDPYFGVHGMSVIV
jgi:hypothetical protein